jgi:hypothetical protein
MSLVFTLPGKIGDALHQWPVAYWHCKATGKKATLWLDENTLKPLVPLFEAQECVEKVELKPGITSYHMGGQPWNFGVKTADLLEHEVYHLGMRQFPMRQITLETIERLPLNVTRMEGPTLTVPVDPQRNRLVLHGTFLSHTSGAPTVWRFISDRWDEFKTLFDEIAFVGTPAERQRALELYPDAIAFDDEANFLNLASYIGSSRMVVGAGSSIVVLAAQLCVPAIRVHDPIGEFPRVIWDNLGENQLNRTELELRDEWPVFRDRWLVNAEVTA